MKTKKEVIQETLDANKEELITLELKERFLQRELISGENKTMLQLEIGTVQTKIKYTEKLIKFLEEVIKEK